MTVIWGTTVVACSFFCCCFWWGDLRVITHHKREQKIREKEQSPPLTILCFYNKREKDQQVRSCMKLRSLILAGDMKGKKRKAKSNCKTMQMREVFRICCYELKIELRANIKRDIYKIWEGRMRHAKTSLITGLFSSDRSYPKEKWKIREYSLNTRYLCCFW